MPHSFSHSLALAQRYEDAPWWPTVYRRAFPGLQSMTSVRRDGWAQRAGIDRLVILSSGKVIKVDEKVRAEDWPDFLLERWSDRDRAIAGWVQKDLDADFIAYAFIPSQRCYLLPFLLLRNAWQQQGRHWIELAAARQCGFRIVLADNEEHGRSWRTESIAVPIEVVLAALQRVMVVNWGADQPTVFIQNTTNIIVQAAASAFLETDEPELPL